MLKRLLLAVALPVLAAAPVHAQTTFFATGGDVTMILDHVPGVPFQFFLEAVGAHPRQLLFTNASPQYPTSFNFGPFLAGEALVFDFVADGFSYSSAGILSTSYPFGTGYWIEYIEGTATGTEPRAWFDLTGVNAASGVECTTNNRILPCTVGNPRTAVATTATPEPGTIALFATGLAGLIPVAIRRRRRA